jgi:hypothetical protein
MTAISIDGERFLIDGTPTYAGRTYEGRRVDGMLFNTRMAQGLFDDANPETVGRWAYPDTGVWDPDRNTDELIAMLPTYASYGIRAISVNLQGGMPVTATESDQPWINTAFHPDGRPRVEYLVRLERLLRAADAAGIVVILGLFYASQDHTLDSEASVRSATVHVAQWLLESKTTNVMIEICNESDIPHFDHDILTPPRVHELVDLARSVSVDGRQVLAGTSFSGGAWCDDVDAGVPTDHVIASSDFVLVHTNAWDPAGARKVIQRVRSNSVFAADPMPIVVNEDSTRSENMFAVFEHGASWGYYDQGENDYRHGFQSVPVNWTINTPDKSAFFDAVAEITGARENDVPRPTEPRPD